MENLKDLDVLFDHILEEIMDPDCPPVKNPFAKEESVNKTVRFRSITPITVKVSDDGLSASIFVCTVGEAQDRFTADELWHAIELKGVKAGIDNEIVERMAEDQIFDTEIVFAEGLPVVNGSDGSIITVAEPDTDISEGDVICEIVPAEEGTDGFDVFGNVLKANRGRAPDVPQGVNTCFNKEHTALVAAASGHLSFQDEVFSVRNEQVIQGDLKRPNDQISFSGDVTIYGNLSEGATVTAGGTVHIRGSATGAYIRGKSVIIDFAVRHSVLTSTGGSIKLSTCAESEIDCDGNMEATAITDCKVFCSGQITCLGSPGTISGGVVSSVSEIVCLNAGSHTHDPTQLILGNCPKFLEEREELLEKLAAIDNDIKRLDERAAELKAKKAEEGKISIEEEDFLNASIRIKLQKIMKKEPLKNRLDYVDEVIGSTDNATLRVMSMLYPNVSIMINNRRCTTDFERGKVTAYSSDTGIVFL